MKTCVSSYSFQPMLSSGELTQLQLIGKVKEMGFDGIEFIDLLPEDGMSVEEYAKRLRDEYVSVEHIFAELIGPSPSGGMGDVCREFGLDQEKFLNAPRCDRRLQRAAERILRLRSGSAHAHRGLPQSDRIRRRERHIYNG